MEYFWILSSHNLYHPVLSHVPLFYPILSPSLSASIQGYHNGLAHTVSGSCDYNADISRYLLEQGAYANMLGSTNAGIIHVSHRVTYDET